MRWSTVDWLDSGEVRVGVSFVLFDLLGKRTEDGVCSRVSTTGILRCFRELSSTIEISTVLQ